jgi:ABC-2 type transport system ATP-binding protein
MRRLPDTAHAARMITMTGLTKSYRGAAVVREVSLHCEPGTITGFLGPNGAGKSTTLRMLVGLARPDSGTATIDGRRFVDLPNPSRIVGTLLDPSAMHAGRTGRATLAIAARMAGVPASRVPELLDLVGLSGAGDQRVGQYSLGMRQRLGIAQALMGEPEVLVLDEPANGLDPEGIAWMRHLLREFTDRGGTVLLSSHLLHEVQATVDDLVVISHGSVVAAGHLRDLLAPSSLIVRTPDPRALHDALRRAGIRHTVQADRTVSVAVVSGDGTPDTAATAAAVARLALEHQLVLTELRPSDTGGLEQLFFSLITDATSEAAA